MRNQDSRPPRTVLAAAILAAACAALEPEQALANSARSLAFSAGPDAGQLSPGYSERPEADDRPSDTGARRSSFETATPDADYALRRVLEPELQPGARTAGLPPEASKPRHYKLFLDLDQSTLNDLGMRVLAAVAADWGDERLALELAGHTDCSQSEPCNQWLSKRGAGRVRDLLVTRGFDPARISGRLAGADDLSVPTLIVEPGPRNRRVTVVITVK